MLTSITIGKEGVRMSNQAFKALIDLVEFDQSVAKIVQQIEANKQHIADFSKQEQALQVTIEQSKQRLLELRKLVDEKELLLKTCEDQERIKREQLDRVHNNKEYVALQAEITQLRLEQHNLEQEIIDAWNKRDMAHAEYDIVRDQAHTKIAQLADQVKQYEQQIAQLETQRTQLQADRVAKVTLVPDEWIEKYNVLGARIQDPVVALEGDACGGCFSPLTNQELLRLNRGALLQCQSCFRFLYEPGAVGA